VYEILVPDDRQPGFRNRSRLSKIDLKSGVMQPLTFGNKNVWVYDLSSDGRYMVFGINRSRLVQRPTSLITVCRMDLQTLQVDTLVREDGFLINMDFIPGSHQLLVTASAEAFNRIGCTLPTNLTPNMYDYQLYLYDISTKQVTPLTRDFNPSVQTIDWTWGDGMVYFTAEDRDFVRLYQMNPANGQIVQLEHAGDNVSRMNVAAHSNVVGYISNGTSEYASAFVAYTAKGKAPMKQVRLYDGKSIMDDIAVADCKDWNYTNARGETVYGRMYLPQDFDATKKYPMIVYYYGGCSPVSRYFDGVYSGHYWA
jgi:dipeptidyl aminopeptidase/acylaminoacyl peptidase